MDLGEIKTTVKDPNETFSFNGIPTNFSLIDFWRWNQSDLIENRNRGILAEFIVKKGLEIKNETRLEWDAYDLITSDNIKIEVKSAAYIQAWPQKKYSSITYNISQTCSLLENNEYSETKKRHADIFIFCLLHHKDQETINPMNLNQCTFYIVSTSIINKKYPNQKTIGLSTIENTVHQKCTYYELKKALDIVL